MKIFLVSMFFASLMPVMAFAEACMPCREVWQMNEMVEKSEVVLLAKRSDTKAGNAYEQGPDFIELEVLEVLKGNGDVDIGDTIDARSWYGICPYGVQMERYEKAVVFLNKESSGFWLFSNPSYEAATYENKLCNDEAMSIKGQNLIIWDPAIRQEVPYPLTEFKRVFVK